MVRLIDADALAKFIDYGRLNNPNEKLYSENDIREMIDMMPTVDAVPVIRCKDCRFWDWMPASTATPDYHLCRRPFQPIAITEYDFCSRAERRDDETN